ncbi:uncharacterized protein LOC126800075 [Argentina anserina]|uniref:uncharacterized protein LOC126800075 n=1 Tax=Argentina anserina TaxID=57926 RepID=UPI0021768995|nr:uncharacterized protein LOC126800075 [Potentilla anserina]
MDSWSFVDNVKAEKASAMRRYNRLLTIARLFRLAELFVAAIFLSWTFTRLPFALRISRDYVRLLSGVVSSPLFVFLVCNAIIASLFAKSRQVATAATSDPNIDVETAQLYDQFADNCGRKMTNSGEDVVSSVKEEVVYQDKQIISEVNVVDPKPEASSDSGMESDLDSGLQFTKAIRRTQSEKFERAVPAKLKRSDTDNCRKMLRSGEETVPEDFDPENDLSNEEFQRAIEAFIEKQKKFRHQEESLAIVHQNQS